MTEAEWLAANDPTPMLEFIQSKASDRKLRLFAVACSRLLIGEQTPDPTRTTIETNELFADQQATEKELSRARSAAHSAGWDARFQYERVPLTPDGGVVSLRTVERPGVPEEHLRRLYFVAFSANTPERLRSEKMPLLGTDPILIQASPSLLRDILGNPFRPVTADPAWLTSTVVALACGIYDERAFDRLPILADALQDAGCDSADLLDHCRGDGPHVRGCWVVDLLLGKE